MTRPTAVPILLGSFAIFLCWLAPGHYYPWITFQNEFVAAIAGLLFGVAAVVAGRNGLAWPRMATFAALMTLVPLIQLLSGQINFVSDGVLVLLYLFALAAAIAVGAALAQTQRQPFLDGIFGALLAAGIVSVGLACIQWLGLGPVGYVPWIPTGERPYANLGQPNHLASLLALAMLGGLWLYETRRIGVTTLALIVAWLILGIVMTRSRMVWIAAIVVACGWFFLSRRTATRLGPKGLIGFIAALAVGVVLWGPLSEWIGTVAPVSVADRVQGGGGRIRIWTALTDALFASPWVGYGWSQVSRAGLVGSLDHFTGESMLRNSHSLPLDLLIWNGIPIGLLTIGVLVWWLIRQARLCNSAERGVVLAAVVVVTVHATFEFPLEYLYFLVPTGLLVGALEVWDDTSPAPTVPRGAVAALLAALAGMTVWVGVEYMRVEEGSRDNRMLAARYSRSAALPDVLLLDEPREYMKFWRTQAREGMSAPELNWMRRIAERNPAPPTLLRYATALGLNGQPAGSARTLVQLCNMHWPERCEEGRKSWAQLQVNFPVLGAIAYPRSPALP